MISIAMHIPGRHDATNWYRGSGPLSALKKRRSEIALTFMTEVSFATAQVHDLAFFQRPSTPSELEAIRIFKRLGIPVIVDYDDLLLDIPTDNPAYRLYMNQQTRETIVTIIREADCVWVSTKELKRCFQIPNAILNERVYVIPNALDNFHLVRGARSAPPKLDKRQQAVLWRGSQTHERDVMEYSPEIAEVAAKNSSLSFVFVGWNPWFLTDRMRPKQAMVSGALPVGEFMDFMYATASQIGVVPLHDSRFNRCKSNIAWLEMTWAGAACLVPDWEEWRHPGAITYSNPDQFKDGLEKLVSMTPVERDAQATMSWLHIQENFMLSKVNDIRGYTINAAIGIGDWPNGFQRLDDPDCVMELE